ncbi:UDP-N-acetylmuramoylalanyl-D-glutamate-2,6- diami nopimelate ligase [Bifidobacterium tsurumiense]|uniref:UDP-N-acetylmuramoylalanyl-D-glutamate-2,6-diami nopimelate ligase n=4 Tax=Bifidobacterium tsurumiense TaxID=356829 RepID=A0A087EJR1_9BIFI|nr:UDP-N-acetylmuramoyl-L-alanyl-D-glutamate--2,6-diaminopimelate ligase [Bifidobacterium tsurumiense]KFJ08012.1 UDP-N-acetylmuramoylalanyl-D-glutamate-2,6- diami nopimelate ligase [Bifidobacterium tsurumiense]
MNTARLTLACATELLQKHGLLREVICGEMWSLVPEPQIANTQVQHIIYDSREIIPGTMLFIKGRFRPEFLRDADSRGLTAYVAEKDYSYATKAPGLIVHDVRKAMSLLAAAFYGHPERDLAMIGITGTKGKTTTAYFTQALLNAYSVGKAALFSSVDNCLDGHTYEESDLTTPESLDAFRMMRTAVDNGMRYLVMEVSSQAYKVHRVHGITFDIGAFLNISPDHISDIEHPTFEDYLYSKRRLIANSRTLILGADSTHIDLLTQDAKQHHTPTTTFALHDPETGHLTHANVLATPDEQDSSRFTLSVDGTTIDGGSQEPMKLAMAGSFNELNAAAAAAIALHAGVQPHDPAMRAMQNVQVPGRMERFGSGNLIAYVDYAHNYLSTKTLVDEIGHHFAERNPRIILVSGSTGGKAIDRREGIVKAAEGKVSSYYFTMDDPNREDPQSIAEEMRSYVKDPEAITHVVLPRERAVEEALQEAAQYAENRLNIVLVIGKGSETANVVNGKRIPYEGDANVVRRMLKTLHIPNDFND